MYIVTYLIMPMIIPTHVVVKPFPRWKRKQIVISKMLDWFNIRLIKWKSMTINSNILYLVETRYLEACVQVGNNEIRSSSHVKLLGVYFDQNLIFDDHVD